MLRIDRISKNFGEKAVLSDFSAEIRKGEPTLITGASGAGKTTLLRIIAGLESADSGSVFLEDGTRISFMFQEPRLFPWMNVIENVMSVLSKADKEKATEILGELGLKNELHAMPSELSGGMKRRVALARTLIFPADWYILDEPFAGLDPVTAKIAGDVILRRTSGNGTIIVSHDASMLPEGINTINIR